MTKAELKMLERAFEAEIYDRLPFQTKSKLAEKLVYDGYLQRMERTFGGRFPVVCKGYALTLLGNMTYCFSCE